MKPSFASLLNKTRHARLLRYVHAYKIKGNVNCWKQKKNKPRMLIFFGRLGIEEPEHLRMR